MCRPIVIVVVFLIGSAAVSAEALAQFSFGFGESSQSHRGHGGSFSMGTGNGGFSVGFGPGGIKMGSGSHPGRPGYPNSPGGWSNGMHSGAPACNQQDCSPRPPIWNQPSKPPQWWGRPQPSARPARPNYVTQPQASPTTRPAIRPNYVPQPEQLPKITERPAQVRPNVIPETAKLPPPAVTPKANAIKLCGRLITPEEMERAKEFFEVRLLELIDRLTQRLPKLECDDNAIVELMTRHGVPGEIQIQLFDCLERGDFQQAEQLWRRVLPKCAVPFHRCPANKYVEQFRLTLRQRRPIGRDLNQVISHLPAEILRDGGCCSADDLVAQLQNEARIRDAFTAEAGPSVVPVSFGRASAGAESWGRPGQASPLPTGIVSLVYHPKLPQDSSVVVNPQLVMIGTGGRGTFRIETGYAAEALGHRIETRAPVPARDTELVRSGILLMNPTGIKINFLVDHRELSLAAGFQRTVNVDESVTISFDSGAGETVRYTLRAATYRFKIANGTLDLTREKFKVSIDNHENTTPFHYIVQGKHAVAEPGLRTTHGSDYPIVIRFDRGNNSQTKQVLYDRRNGTLYAAVNAADHLWDLFDSDASPTGGPPRPAMPIVQRDSNYIPAF